MGIGVIIELNLKPGGVGKVRALMVSRLPKVRSWSGNEHVYLGQDENDPNRLFLVEKWTSREQYDGFREWAMKQPDTEEMMSYLNGEMVTTYLLDMGV